MSKRIQLGHGAGGRASARLVRDVFLAHLGNPELARLEDGARLDLSGRLALSTDAFVIDPLFFPGGDIGKLAVCGTVNDVAMCGARPRALAAAFVLEEGLEIQTLERIVEGMADQASRVSVPVVTGDTKVVPRGKGDGVYIATTGIGERIAGVEVGADRVRPGDRVIVSGTLADHGAAIMAVRAGIELGGSLRSDCAPVDRAVADLLSAVPEVRCLRDPTRGGLAVVVDEIANASNVGFQIREADIPLANDTRTACDVLGLDPLHLPSEGRFLAFVPPDRLDQALEVLRERSDCARAVEIGAAVAEHPGRAQLLTSIGGTRLLDVAEGEILPRIC